MDKAIGGLLSAAILSCSLGRFIKPSRCETLIFKVILSSVCWCCEVAIVQYDGLSVRAYYEDLVNVVKSEIGILVTASIACCIYGSCGKGEQPVASSKILPLRAALLQRPRSPMFLDPAHRNSNERPLGQAQTPLSRRTNSSLQRTRLPPSLLWRCRWDE